jgi:hypothetical protein
MTEETLCLKGTFTPARFAKTLISLNCGTTLDRTTLLEQLTFGLEIPAQPASSSAKSRLSWQAGRGIAMRLPAAEGPAALPV